MPANSTIFITFTDNTRYCKCPSGVSKGPRNVTRAVDMRLLVHFISHWLFIFNSGSQNVNELKKLKAS
jgi:hypothetical protein